MASLLSVPVPDDTQGTEIVTTPPAIGELEKILIQDLLDRRKKGREAILDNLRYLGIVLTAGIAYYMSKIGDPVWQQVMTPETKSTVAELTGVTFLLGAVLAFGYALMNIYHWATLRQIMLELNGRLGRWQEQIDDTTIIKLAWRLVIVGLLFTIVFLMMMAGMMYISAQVQSQHSKNSSSHKTLAK